MYEKNSHKWKHFSKSDRSEIKILLNKKYSQRAIARVLNRSNSSVSDEIKLGSVRGIYDPLKAHHKAYVRRKYSKYQGMKIVSDISLQKSVDVLLFKGESPPNISGRLKKYEKAPFLEKILPVKISEMEKAFLLIKERFPELKTITTDNDILFQKHKELKKLLGINIYFCHPYHSWEKGTVENVNKYIRRDIPKGSNISKYSKKFIRSIETKLQNKIYKVLNYKTPLEVLEKHRQRKNTSNSIESGCSD